MGGRADGHARHGPRRREEALPGPVDRAVQRHDRRHAHGHAGAPAVPGPLRDVGRALHVLLPRRGHRRPHGPAGARLRARRHAGRRDASRPRAGHRVPDHQHPPRRRRGRAPRPHLPAARGHGPLRRDGETDPRRRAGREIPEPDEVRDPARARLLRHGRDGRRHARARGAPRDRVVAARLSRHPEQARGERLRQLPQARVHDQAREVPLLTRRLELDQGPSRLKAGGGGRA
mmetsp:Transcript_22005/g.65961  ORF Transcript_22005/g.65961 Transcript_22005/m.65961 type:complete len:232 (+) Transcript_22005:599-1294(+)